MSGQITSNVFRGSGVIAATAGGLNWVSTVVTASTLTAEAGNGYFINTTSNTCTITLPSSAEAGDQIVFMDYLRTWGTNKIIIDSNGLNYQGDPDTYTVEYDTDGETVNIVYSGATKGWIPLNDDEVTDAPTKKNKEGIFGFGRTSGGYVDETNLVSNTGVVSSDTTGVGTDRGYVAACSYGEDKGIFGFGYTGSVAVGTTNLVSNTGVVASDVSAVGGARYSLAACEYGEDKGIFGFGEDASGAKIGTTNLVSNTGVVSSDVSAVGTARDATTACGYGGDKGIVGFGRISGGSNTGITNLISNTGVVASDVTGVGTARRALAACSYGGDKGIFGFGYTASNVDETNLVSNTGVVATDVTGVGTDRASLGACSFN